MSLDRVRRQMLRRRHRANAWCVCLLLFAGCASGPATLPAASDDIALASRGVEVPATWVRPARSAAAPVPLVVLIHGHGGTRHEAGGFTRLAEQLAALGYASIRMDFPGCGDSREPWQHNNLTNMLADVRAAIDTAGQDVGVDTARIGLVGFSMGGRLAALLAAEDPRIDTLALWAPAVEDGAGAIVEMLGGEARYAAMRAQAKRDGWVPFTTFWGQQQRLGARWFEDMERSRPLQALAGFDGALLLVHGSADMVVPHGISRRAEQAATRARALRRVIIDGADHGFGLFADPDPYSARLVSETAAFIAAEL